MNFDQNDILILIGLISAFIVVWSSPKQYQILQLKILAAFCISGLFWLAVSVLLPRTITVALLASSHIILSYCLYRYHFNLFWEKSPERGFSRIFVEFFAAMTGGMCLSWLAYYFLHMMLAITVYATRGVPVFTAHQMEQAPNSLFILFDASVNSIIVFSVVTLPAALISFKLVTKQRTSFNDVLLRNLKAIGAVLLLCLVWLFAGIVKAELFSEVRALSNSSLVGLIVASASLYAGVYSRTLQLPNGQKIGLARVSVVLALQIVMSLFAVALYIMAYFRLWRLW